MAVLVGALVTGGAGGGFAGYNSSNTAMEQLRTDLIEHRLEGGHSLMRQRMARLEQDATVLVTMRENQLKLCAALKVDCK